MAVLSPTSAVRLNRLRDNMVEPRVVATVVNYNSGKLLVEAIDSLLDNSMQPSVEVVDNASTDDSMQRLAERFDGHPRVNIRRNSRNAGFSRGHNQVMRNVEGDYFLLLNPDCIVDRSAISRFVSTLEREPGVGLAGGMLKNADGSVQKTSKRRFPTPWNSLARTLGLHGLAAGPGSLGDFDLAREDDEARGVEYVEAISGAMMFARASALAEVGLLDEGYFMHCEDLDWCKRFWEAGYKVAYVPAAKAMHLKGGSGRDARVIWHLHRGMIRFYGKHYRSRYSAAFAMLVYAGIYLRGASLVAWSLVKPKKRDA